MLKWMKKLLPDTFEEINSARRIKEEQERRLREIQDQQQQDNEVFRRHEQLRRQNHVTEDLRRIMRRTRPAP